VTVCIPDFEIKIMAFRVLGVCTVMGVYQHFEGTLKVVSSSYSTQKVEAARFLQNMVVIYKTSKSEGHCLN
jgi:hypothetical protein